VKHTADQVFQKIENRNGRIRCPVHQGKDFNVSIRDGHTGLLITPFSCSCGRVAILKEINKLMRATVTPIAQAHQIRKSKLSFEAVSVAYQEGTELY